MPILPDPVEESKRIVAAAAERDITLRLLGGLAVRVQRVYDINYRAIRYGVDILYGVAVLRPTLGSVVLS